MLRPVNINVANNTPLRTPKIGVDTGKRLMDEPRKLFTIGEMGKNEKLPKSDWKVPQTEQIGGKKEKFVKEQQQRKVYPSDSDLRCTYTGWNKDRYEDQDCYEDTTIRQLESAPFQPLLDDWPKDPNEVCSKQYSWLLEIDEEGEENLKN